MSRAWHVSLAALAFSSFTLGSRTVVAERANGGYDGHPISELGVCGTHSPSAVPESARIAHATVSPVIFLNRCNGGSGCTITGATSHNAMNDRTAIRGTMSGTVYQFPEFPNHLGETGAEADDEWNEIVACVRKVYSYYNMEVTDVRPQGQTYHMAVLAGTGSDLGDPGGGGPGTLLGISDVSCVGPLDNIISFTFAETIRATSGANRQAFIREVCWTATHEIGHAYSLEHEFQFLDGDSACTDPMSYETGSCTPPTRFFRNRPAKCGGFEEMPCVCSNGGSQNSHLKLSAIFGDNPTPGVGPPTARVVLPTAGGSVGAQLAGEAGSERGVEKVELIINGFKWAEREGAAFGQLGQPNPSTYQFPVPSGLPDSIVDVVVRACDDAGACTDSPVVTATKGAACQTADTCAKGQKCEAGKCFWDPPAGELGADCEFPQFCLSGICQGTADQQICTQNCVPGSTDSCPEDMQCVTTGPAQGICFFADDGGGCCSAGGDEGAPWAHLGGSALLLGLLIRRRRRAA